MGHPTRCKGANPFLEYRFNSRHNTFSICFLKMASPYYFFRGAGGWEAKKFEESSKRASRNPYLPELQKADKLRHRVLGPHCHSDLVWLTVPGEDRVPRQFPLSNVDVGYPLSSPLRHCTSTETEVNLSPVNNAS